jgi:adenine-specific DNA-methyltransferase
LESRFKIAFEVVQELVRTFEASKRAYLGQDYSEAQVRKDFIDKFFIALGWDVNHDIQKNPYEQEVKVEPSVIVGATQRHADYAFRLAPNFNDVRFYVEAKKPSATIATKENYFQVIRYGWNSQTPLAVLTDFKHFHIIDCRFKPDPDTALNNSIATYHYTEYADREKFALIYWLFSREAVFAGSIQKRASELPKPHGKVVQRGLFPGAYKPVDESFLEELDEFRTDLARAFKITDPDLDSETLTELTQRTLDRLVFLRFLEDKGIEIRDSINNFGDKGTVWEDFIAACRRLDDIYNGIVFKQHSILDIPTFRVDNAIFEGICERLAAVNTPYDFNSIPIHILGSIYERFLGNVIIATAKRVHIEEKPDIRKAGGVYYTPEYISRYIVTNTVGKLIAGRTPNEIADMRFADIACGSGSFLLCIYDFLLQYHGSYYNALSERERARTLKSGDCIERSGKIFLSLRKKREILINNIYGVDIDAQAVEVTQLSLFLRLLQEETTVSTRQYLLEFEHIRQMRKLLPDLNKNIICGNSLIGRDFQQDLFGEDERELNPMNFEDAFPEVMKRGGFDAVVGNPPYRRELDYKHLLNQIGLGTFGQKYRSPRMDLWYYFVHRGLEILKPKGVLSFIVNAYWTSGKGAEKLIATLRDSAHLDEVFLFGKLNVFHRVSGQHMILRVTNARSRESVLVKLVRPDGETTAEPFVTGTALVDVFSKPVSQVFRHGKIDLQPSASRILAKIEQGTSLEELGNVRQGIAENPASINRKTNEKFGGRWQVGEGVFALRPTELRRLGLSEAEKMLLRPYHDLCDINRYWLAERPSLSLIYSTRNTCPNIKIYPRLHAHLTRFCPLMEKRRETQNGSNSWWHLHWPRDEQIWQAPKIISLQMAKRPCFVASKRPVYVPFSVNVFVPNPDTLEDLNYFAGLMNSKLLWCWYSRYAKRRGIGLEINGNVLARTPIRRINFASPIQKARHDAMVAKVEAIIEAKRRLIAARTDKDKTYYGNKCASIDRQIDTIVYDLYGLTEEEIKVVEKMGNHQYG